MGEWFLSKTHNRLDVFWIALASMFVSHGKFGYACLVVVVGALAVATAEVIHKNRVRRVRGGGEVKPLTPRIECIEAIEVINGN